MSTGDWLCAHFLVHLASTLLLALRNRDVFVIGVGHSSLGLCWRIGHITFFGLGHRLVRGILLGRQRCFLDWCFLHCGSLVNQQGYDARARWKGPTFGTFGAAGAFFGAVTFLAFVGATNPSESLSFAIWKPSLSLSDMLDNPNSWSGEWIWGRRASINYRLFVSDGGDVTTVMVKRKELAGTTPGVVNTESQFLDALC
jgi:hypothetical protein